MNSPSLSFPAASVAAHRPVLPGLGLTLGFTVTYLSVIVPLPLSAAFLKTFTMTWSDFVNVVSSPRVLASYRLSFGAALIGAGINTVFGGVVAWVLVRYRSEERRVGKGCGRRCRAWGA